MGLRMIRAKRAGRKQAQREAREADYERAEKIRNAGRSARADDRMTRIEFDDAQGTETEKALCFDGVGGLGRVFADSIRRHDTVQTRKEVGEIYAAFAAVCPKHADLIP